MRSDSRRAKFWTVELVRILAADDFEEGDAAGEGVGHGFVDVEGEGLFVEAVAGDGVVVRGGSVGAAVGGFAVGGFVGDDGLALGGVGGVDVEEVEEVVGADVAEAAGVEDGEDAVFADGFVEGGDEVVFGDGAFAEELFHELVFAFGYQFDEGFVGGFGFGFEGGGDGADGAAAVAAGLVEVGLHGDEVDDAVEALLVDDGELEGDDLAAPALLHLVDEGRGSRWLWRGPSG